MTYNCYDGSLTVKIVIRLVGLLLFVACFFCILNYCLAGRYRAEHSLIVLSYGHAWLLVCILASMFMSLWHRLASKLLLHIHTDRIIRQKLTGHVVAFEAKNNMIIKKQVEFEWQGQKFTLPIATEDTGALELNEQISSFVELRIAHDCRLLGAEIID